MSVVARKNARKKDRIYHKKGCIHEQRIKAGNHLTVTVMQAKRKGYRECKYCAGLRGDARIQQRKHVTRKDVTFTYVKQENELYIATWIGFWKVCVQRRSGEYLLYHRNSYTVGMNVTEAIKGEFHRQSDVEGTTSMDCLVEYILKHDRAKVTVMDDYKKLPRRTRKERYYYQLAERNNRRKAMRRVNKLFALLEQSDETMKQYSIC